MISKDFNIAKQVRDCLRRNSDGDWYITERTESAVRRLVYKAYRKGRKDGMAIAERMPVGRVGADGKEVHRPVKEVKL